MFFCFLVLMTVNWLYLSDGRVLVMDLMPVGCGVGHQWHLSAFLGPYVWASCSEITAGGVAKVAENACTRNPERGTVQGSGNQWVRETERQVGALYKIHPADKFGKLSALNKLRVKLNSLNGGKRLVPNIMIFL